MVVQSGLEWSRTNVTRAVRVLLKRGCRDASCTRGVCGKSTVLRRCAAAGTAARLFGAAAKCSYLCVPGTVFPARGLFATVARAHSLRAWLQDALPGLMNDALRL
ncbi:hypothetical protein HPB50_005522 [Hyalomma asiaticum]|uniref:Uncharacterized protein n=1 Tax=Hyalomma asiaticum TaxID=266040 RepID=A0ACB7TCV7_HYAAI|nr:hypothetical protein HPB50_005522 [Hyalomma asiaticum]